VIQNDDADSQFEQFRSLADGCVLTSSECSVTTHRNYQIKLFESPPGVKNNTNDWPIRLVLSSFYLEKGQEGVPDGKSDCSLCKFDCESCINSVAYKTAYEPDACGYGSKQAGEFIVM
jgi:alpha-amylase